MDLATNSSVQVDASQPMGLLITNGEFTAFRDPKGIGKQFVDPSVGPPDPAQVNPFGNRWLVCFRNDADALPLPVANRQH